MIPRSYNQNRNTAGIEGFAGLHLIPLCFTSLDARQILTRVVALLAGAFLPLLCSAATPPGTVIPNVAAVAYSDAAGVGRSVASNSANIVTKMRRTPARLQFVRVDAGGGTFAAPTGPSSCETGSGLTLLPPPVLADGTQLNVADSQPLSPAQFFHTGEAFFVEVADPDQNLDSAVAETVEVQLEVPASGDLEIIQLTESAPDSGQFVGYVPSAAMPSTRHDCQLQVAVGYSIRATYVDPADSSDVTTDSALVDPLGIVFDSQTGVPVDGAIVRLIEVTSGLPAFVFGDDGASEFPAEVVSGGVATDSGGADYDFDPGAYRYPLVSPGQYRLEVTPPAGYTAPSTTAIIDLQALPGAPFNISAGSFGDPFMVDPGPAIMIDIPLDPVSTVLFLQKSTATAVASIGDFLKYTLTLENPDTLQPINNVIITDELPVGLRLIPGSVRVDGSSAPDPAVSADRRQLQFDIGDLPPAGRTVIDYVAEIVAGSRGPEAINTAIARAAGGAESNVATATVRLAEALFRSRSTVLGRVISGSCDADVGNDTDGVAGVRIYLEDGRYVVSDEGGRYHFEGVRPGGHVVQLDVDTVPEGFEIVPCERNARFAGRSYSQFIDVRAGALWRADFHLRQLPAPSGEVAVALSSRAAGQDVIYTLTVGGDGVPVSNVRTMVMLPDNVIFVPGSVRLDGARSGDPTVSGNLLTFPLSDAAGAPWQRVIQFRGLPGAAAGEHVTKALVSFDTETKKRQRTPLADNTLIREPPVSDRVDLVFTTNFDTRKAELKARDRARIAEALSAWEQASDLHVVISGHTDNVRIAPQNRHEFADNYVLSRARATAAAEFIQSLLQLAPEQISISGNGPDKPVASNAGAAGRAKNRRVELQLWGQMPVSPGAMRLGKTSSGPQRLEVAREQKLSLAQLPVEASDPLADFNDPAWVSRLDPGSDLVFPLPGYNPPIPSLRIAVKHAPRQKVEVALNGAPVSALSFEGTDTNAAKTVSLSRWRGVDIAENDNQLVVVVRDADGTVVRRIERNVHLSGGPVRAEVDREASSLLADGRTRPVLAVRLYDRWGYPARPESIGTFRVDPPYRSWFEVESLRENQLLELGNRQPLYRVGADGLARIELEATSLSGEVVLHMEYADEREEELRAWLEPATREWILVGFAEGTAGYSTLNDNVQSAKDAGYEEDFYTDGRVAFFAKGRIKGDYLLTLAYDSDRDEQEARQRLHGTIDPDRFYTLYGDATEQQFDAASQDEIFVKLERGQFYAMFGDYDTGMTVTELSRYDRSFNGFQSEYQGERFGYTAFTARTDQAFVKEELRGDGTSGLYRLSRQPLVINSEKITLETRDRFRSEEIVSSRTLTRHLDYDIDYLAGTIFFKEPVRHRDERFNPVFIVVDYESRDPVDRSTTAGGRASLRLADGRVEVGATMIDEGTSGADGDLQGLDLKLRIADGTELRAEFASSDTRQGGVPTEGDAAIAELRHTAGKVDGKVYYRQIDTEFGLGQQRAAETGMRKMGFDGRLRFSKHLSIDAAAYRQDNLESDVRREVYESGLRWQRGAATAGVGYRDATDEARDGTTAASEQVFVNGSIKTMGNRLTLRGSLDSDLGDDANIAYPTRTIVGLDYKLNDDVTLYTEHERAEGRDIESQMTRTGVRATPWNRAQFNSSVSQEMTEYGPRAFATLGLVQGWQINERWAMDFGVDHSNTLTAPGAGAFNPDAGLPSGSEAADFTSLYVGTLYKHDDWTVNTRSEWRNSDDERRAGLFGGFYREEKQGRAFSAALQFFNSQRDVGVDLTDADIRLSWAYRPATARWVFLDRLDLEYEELKAIGTQTESSRIVNNLHANWMINRSNQLGFQYGVKYVRSDIDGNGYNGFTDLVGIDWRRDFSSRWDAGVQGSLLHSWNSDVVDYSIGADIGYSFARNVWLSLGYNFAGFDDEDFSDARYTARGPYIRFRFKADQDNLRDRDFWARRESND
ncbi:MAG: OmpA family protein [Gammaproteobacteria bacterium]|nr:OmpA family protein [Gammaproteobacteria bacterium]NNM21273.1 OmpA family protein [Gammaproteobacteria bacterium]